MREARVSVWNSPRAAAGPHFAPESCKSTSCAWGLPPPPAETLFLVCRRSRRGLYSACALARCLQPHCRTACCPLDAQRAYSCRVIPSPSTRLFRPQHPPPSFSTSRDPSPTTRTHRPRRTAPNRGTLVPPTATLASRPAAPPKPPCFRGFAYSPESGPNIFFLVAAPASTNYCFSTPKASTQPWWPK